MKRHVAIGTAFAAVAIATPLPAQAPVLAMLDGLERGSWELRIRDNSGHIERICLDDTHKLIQLRHPRERCERLVVDDRPNEVTVQYSCRNHGYGRTHIRRETNRLIQLDTQGIANGLPYAFAAEARRVGDCRR